MEGVDEFLKRRRTRRNQNRVEPRAIFHSQHLYVDSIVKNSTDGLGHDLTLSSLALCLKEEPELAAAVDTCCQPISLHRTLRVFRMWSCKQGVGEMDGDRYISRNPSPSPGLVLGLESLLPGFSASTLLSTSRLV